MVRLKRLEIDTRGRTPTVFLDGKKVTDLEVLEIWFRRKTGIKNRSYFWAHDEGVEDRDFYMKPGA